ncbi:hypothetical protein BDR05DRAFT_978180 [Suillus weaverae]|nr:hypothetical protein BDR05DRAFT_978180 [Suillus weaverae]
MDLQTLLKPPHSDGVGYKDPPKLNAILKERLERMRDFLWLYTNVVAGDGPSPANPAYIKDCNTFPLHKQAQKFSCIYDESLAANLKLYLQSIGKFVHTQDLVEYLSIPEHQAHHEPNGQYCDGHKWEDIIYFQQNVFLPVWNHYQTWMTKWKCEGEICVEDVEANAALSGRQIIVWFHDKWVHSSKGAVPQPKGEGASLMVANFISADYGWLHSPDGEESPRVLFWAGKACNRYFMNNDILAHATKAMDILEKWYSHEDYVLTIKDANGNIVLGPDGKPLKEKIPMAEARLPGNPQSLYFPDGHPKAGFFKGMAQILVERGYVDAPKLHAECKDFKCSTDSRGVCCCHQLMYIQPDFVNVESCLETSCRAQSFDVIFLPKFHCKLNFIEQCWGFTKWLYQMKDWSSSEEVLERNVIESLNAIPMDSMQRFTMRSARFIDAYQKGLNGTQAAWAIKKYCGHHVLLQTILDELDCPALP